MQRFIASLVAILMIATSSVPALGQSSRYRVPTQVSQDTKGSAPSFRGGEQQGYEVLPQQQIPGYGLQPGMSVQGGGSGEGGITQMALGYQVHVLGEVMRPGTYKMPPSGRLADAIKMAGGLANNGSERKIELKRNGKIIQVVDLMRFSLFGSLSDNPYLLDNDVVYVPLRQKVVRVVGAVKRPDTYELRNEKKLNEVIELVGGFNAATALDANIKIIRFVDGEKTVKEVPLDSVSMKRFEVVTGDVIVVPNVVTKETEFDYNVASIPGDKVFYPSYEDRVFVLGGVAVPGAYPFSPYYTVNQYISLAGGLNDRGKEKYRIIDISGKSRAAKENDRVNPGDTVMIRQRWMSPAGWLGFALGVASFGLSASATIIAITR
jgi:protein involved in polysaccharide export with SLBB domain